MMDVQWQKLVVARNIPKECIMKLNKY